MIVGAALVELHVHGSSSLKQKRGVVKSILQRVRSRFNVSIAEVGGQDTWQRALLGLSVVGIEAPSVRRSLERTIRYIEELHLAEIRDSDIEILNLPQIEHVMPLPDEPLPWELAARETESGASEEEVRGGVKSGSVAADGEAE